MNTDAHWLGPLGMPTRHVANASLGGTWGDTITILPLIINGFQRYINDQTITNS